MLIIKVIKGNINQALKQYKSKTIKTRLLRELKERKEFEKPSETKRKAEAKAKYVNKKYRGED
jgi:small subunit ribosomal protein S21